MPGVPQGGAVVGSRVLSRLARGFDMFAHSRSFSAEPFPDLEGRFELGSLGAADSDKGAQLLNGRGVHSSQPFVAVQQPPRQFLRAHARRPRPQDDCKKLCGSKRFGANRLKEGSRLLFLDPLSYRKTSFLLRGHPMKEGPQSPLLPGRAIPSALLLPPATLAPPRAGPPVDQSSSETDRSRRERASSPCSHQAAGPGRG